jgi:hypothetical protein
MAMKFSVFFRSSVSIASTLDPSRRAHTNVGQFYIFFRDRYAQTLTFLFVNNNFFLAR